MKKLYSISLEEGFAKVFDDYCIKSGMPRSEIISRLISEHINKGSDPCSEHNAGRDKVSTCQAMEVLTGAKAGKSYPINKKGTTIIGRKTGDIAPDIDLSEQLRQGEPAVSRQHAELTWKNNVLFIMDLGSVNGTYVNGQKIVGQKQIGNGDRIKFANVEVKIVFT